MIARSYRGVVVLINLSSDVSINLVVNSSSWEEAKSLLSLSLFRHSLSTILNSD